VVSLPSFNVNGELHLDELDNLEEAINFPALFSGMLLYAVSGSALLAARSEPMPWVPLAVFFAFMGTDELFKIHETIEHGTGVDWQIIYLPVVLVAGAFWLAALDRISRFSSERMLWLGGAAAWIIAQLLEVVSNAGGDNWTVLAGEFSGAEEVLEMLGSSLFLLALFLVRSRSGARDYPRPQATTDERDP
jgi:hypothetical protein